MLLGVLTEVCVVKFCAPWRAVSQSFIIIMPWVFRRKWTLRSDFFVHPYSVQAKKKQRRRAPGAGALGKYHYARAGAIVGVFSGRQCASAEVSALTEILFQFMSCLAPAVQPVYPRAPGHEPETNLQKALEEWNAVCHLAGGPCGSLYWALREKFCDSPLFVSD